MTNLSTYFSSWFGKMFCCQNEISAPTEKNSDEDDADAEKEPFTPIDENQNGDLPNKSGGTPVITEQPRTHESQVFFCCSSSEVKLRENQIDFCPQYWFQDLKSSPNTCKKLRRFLWRLSFLVTCLPLCYPCYLSRTVRRRPKQRKTELNIDKLLHFFSVKNKNKII